MALDYSFDTDFSDANLSDSVWAGIQGMGSSDDESGWASILKNLGGSTGIMSLISSAYGLYGSNKITNMSEQAYKEANPFGPYRPQYAAQLQQLMADPSSVTSQPGYQFQFDQGAQAVSRRMWAAGFHNSSNEAIALTKYGQDYASSFYDKELQRLMTLSGATITPAAAGTGIQGAATGLDFAGQALASLGYGVTKKDGFSAAGGVAADVKTGIDLASLGVNLLGGDVPSSVGAVSKGLGVVSGVTKGTPQGLTSAYKNASSLLGGGASVVKNPAMDAAAAQGASAASKSLTGFGTTATTAINVGAGIMSGLAASGDKYASIGNAVGSLFGPMGAIAGTVLGGVVSSIVDPGKNNYEGQVGLDGSFKFTKIPGGRDVITTYMFGSDEKTQATNASTYYAAAIQKYLETGDKQAAASLLGDTGPTGYKFRGDKNAMFERLFTGTNNIGSQLNELRKLQGG